MTGSAAFAQELADHLRGRYAFDATLTQVLGDRFAKIFGWYDNEMGFSHRMVDLAQILANKG